MDEQQFWDVIAEARRQGGEDAEAVAAHAADLLAARPRADILDAERVLQGLLADSYRGELWGAAYLINGGCSDDGFDYFRGWLVTRGREVFEQAVAEPDSLAGLAAVRAAAEAGEDLDGEDTLAVAWTAHRAATGEDLPDDCFTLSYPDIRFAWDFDDEGETARRLPRLSALFAQD
ncbi:DUF4240 domain-containing protein [Kitasatospora paranensis]|uniref:DUF4240 domain-containing protein n=1 Tax=Kitasatospora paranensis TaxID=258053 RepID=A0ABW2G405_9ACTN